MHEVAANDNKISVLPSCIKNANVYECLKLLHMNKPIRSHKKRRPEEEHLANCIPCYTCIKYNDDKNKTHSKKKRIQPIKAVDQS